MSVEESLDLLTCTDMFQLDGLTKIFENRVGAALSSKNFLHVLRHARTNNLEKLKAADLNFIHRHQTDPVVKECLGSFPVESVDDGKMIQEVLHYLMRNGTCPSCCFDSGPSGNGADRPPSTKPARGGMGRGGRSEQGREGWPFR